MSGPAVERASGRQLDLLLDRASPVPIYHQLAEQIERAIRNGTLQPGETIEHEVSLAQRLELSRPTVRHAIAELVTRGLVSRRRGVGTTVTADSMQSLGMVTSLFDELTAQGLTPATKVLRLVHGEIDRRVALRLELDPGAPLIALERLRLANGAPIALLRNWLPLDLTDLAPTHLESTGLYEFLSRRGITASVTQQTIGSRAASADERRVLALGRSDSILTVTQLAQDSDGRPLDYGEHIYRADRYQFRVTRQTPQLASPAA